MPDDSAADTEAPRHRFHHRYAVIGAGAVGGFYGGLLADAGAEVHFLLRGDYAQVMEQGLRIVSRDGEVHIADVHAHRSTDTMPLCDAVIVTLKTTQNDVVGDLVPPILAPGGTVVMLQNGLGNEDDARAALGPDVTLVGGLAFICVRKTQAGLVEHLDYGAVNFAQHTDDGTPAGETPAVRALVEDFGAAGLEASAIDDLRFARWRKLVWNIPFNGLSVVLDARTDELLADPNTLDLVETLMDEVVRGAGACGVEIPDSFVEQMVEDTKSMKPYAPSMKLDADARRPLEVEAIYGAPLRAARAAGTALPHIDTLYRQLSFLDTRLQSREP